MAKSSAQQSEAPVSIETIERRQSPRSEFVVRVNYRTVDSLFSEFASNINAGGIFVETDTPQPIGAKVELEFKLPGADQLVEVAGLVVRMEQGESGDPRGMGIEFEKLSAEVRQQINEIIRRLRPR
jgi:type IV pilus assembly protein PilZ